MTVFYTFVIIKVLLVTRNNCCLKRGNSQLLFRGPVGRRINFLFKWVLLACSICFMSLDLWGDHRSSWRANSWSGLEEMLLGVCSLSTGWLKWLDSRPSWGFGHNFCDFTLTCLRLSLVSSVCPLHITCHIFIFQGPVYQGSVYILMSDTPIMSVFCLFKLRNSNMN